MTPDDLLTLYKQYEQSLGLGHVRSFDGFMYWLERLYWSKQTLPPIKINQKEVSSNGD